MSLELQRVVSAADGHVGIILDNHVLCKGEIGFFLFFARVQNPAEIDVSYRLMPGKGSGVYLAWPRVETIS